MRKVLIAFFLVILLVAGCGLDTSGDWSPEVWIDAPWDGVRVGVENSVAVTGATNYEATRMILNVEGVPVVALDVTQVSGGLWLGMGTWTPVSPGSYTLSISATISGREYTSREIVANVVTIETFPMLEATPTPQPTSTVTPTAWPAAQVNFYADTLTITRGGCTILHWEAAYATGVYLNSEFVAQIGSRQVCPQDTTVYTLNVQAPAGNVEQQVTITVNVPTVYVPPPVTTPPDTGGPDVTNLSHSPDVIYDGATCGSINANVTVKASDPSGISTVVLYYRVVRGSTQGTWRNLTMNHTGGKNYQANLGPAELQASLSSYSGGTVEYYVQASDGHGNMTQSGGRSFEVKVCLI
jgi:hypothetical protein